MSIDLKAQDIIASTSVGEYIVVTIMDQHRIYTEPAREMIKAIEVDSPLLPTSGEKSQDWMRGSHDALIKKISSGELKISKPALSLKDSLQNATPDEEPYGSVVIGDDEPSVVFETAVDELKPAKKATAKA